MDRYGQEDSLLLGLGTVQLGGRGEDLFSEACDSSKPHLFKSHLFTTILVPWLSVPQREVLFFVHKVPVVSAQNSSLGCGGAAISHSIERKKLRHSESRGRRSDLWEE